MQFNCKIKKSFCYNNKFVLCCKTFVAYCNTNFVQNQNSPQDFAAVRGDTKTYEKNFRNGV